MYSFSKKWDLTSLILYVLMAVIGAICFYVAKKKERETGKKQKLFSLPFVIWIVIWTVFASFRLVVEDIGGSDAILYKNYFQICLSDNIIDYYQHYDIFYKLINIVIRFFTSDYHIFFIIFYSFSVISYILFLNEFSDKKTNISPYLLTFYLFLRSFNTFRSNLAISFILVALVLYKRDKKKLSFLLMLLTFFIQKASILYSVCLFLFLFFFERKELKIKFCFLLSLIGYIIGKCSQYLLINVIGDGFNGAYASYAKRSLTSSFFDNFWKICFGQLLLLGFVLIFNKKLKKKWENDPDEIKNKNKLLYKICLFDFITIPITYTLSIWRGYEFLYIARLVMWNELLNLILSNLGVFDKKMLKVVSFIIFISWLIFRINHTWYDSSLMPYIFEPFISMN